jgi:hypothetical protein
MKMKLKKRIPRRIAPKLASGNPREPFWISLPAEYKAGFQAIADMENESASWAAQQVLIDFAHGRLRIALPKYKRPKGKVIRMRARRSA